MPGNPATEGIIESRGGKFPADPKKKQELDEIREKKKAVVEVGNREELCRVEGSL